MLYRGFISLGVHFACLSFVVVTPVYCTQFALIIALFVSFKIALCDLLLFLDILSLFSIVLHVFVVVCWIC